MMTTFKSSGLVNWAMLPSIILCAVITTIPAHAATGVVLPGGMTSSSEMPTNSVHGYEFIPNVNILLNAIGVYDAGSNGLASPHTVAVWADDGSIIAQELFAFGSGVLEDGFEYLSILPILLEADRKYVIGVLYPSTNLDTVAVAVFGAEYIVHPNITITEGRLNAGGFGLPLTQTGEVFFGPNFQFTAVPLPGAAWLLISALGAMLISRRAT